MLGVVPFSNMGMGEEQEREVNHEIERIREVERPPKATAAKHSVHEHVRRFVQTGVLTPQSSQFVPIFLPLNNSTLAPPDPDQIWSPQLLATKDFSITIMGSIGDTSHYLRPVNWIASVTDESKITLVMLSPFEVDILLPEFRAGSKVHLHQYAPKTTPTMESFEELKFHCIPPLPSSWSPPSTHLRNQLNLWAGQLYLPDHERYQELCNFLGLYLKEHQDNDAIVIQTDGFIKPVYRQGTMLRACPFHESPVPFLKHIMGLRRKYMGYSSTHLGKMLRALLLTEDDF